MRGPHDRIRPGRAKLRRDLTSLGCDEDLNKNLRHWHRRVVRWPGRKAPGSTTASAPL